MTQLSARSRKAAPATAATPNNLPTDAILSETSSAFALVADRTRLKILMLLHRQGVTHVGAICEALGMAQPAVSHHLALLRYARMIQAERQGKHNIYTLAPRAKGLVKAAETLMAGE